MRVADNAWLASKGDDGTVLKKLAARDALMESTKSAVTTYRHPLFAFPDVPIVLVEGKFDEIYLRLAMEAAAVRPRWKLLSPDAALGEGSGGDALYQTLKYNQHVVQSRPNSAPVVVLRDWEATDKAKYDAVLRLHPYSECLIAPGANTNPELDEEFVGIERFLSTDFIKNGVEPAKLGTENGKYTIKKRNLNAAKQSLAALAGTGETVGPFMESLARWLDAEVNRILGTIPPGDFH